MICTNPECEMYGKETLRSIIVRGGDEYSYCIYCDVPIDKDMQPIVNDPGPYVKRGIWLKEWKLVNSGKHLDQMKFNPNLK